MMGTKQRDFRALPEDLSLEDLVPEDNFYRRLEERLNLSFVRDLVRDRYASSGRPSIDPEVFFRLQLILFFEGLRSERQLMRVVADSLSLRWYCGYDLHESLPDHSSLTRIRERYGLETFRRFFEEIVERCVEVGLVEGEELFFDSTRVKASAARSSVVPRLTVVGEHLDGLFEALKTAEDQPPSSYADIALPAAEDAKLQAANVAQKDWISRSGRPDRSVKRGSYCRKSDGRTNRTDPDAHIAERGAAVAGPCYRVHYVVDGGNARVILSVLAVASDVKDNQPMLDLLWRCRFRWRLRPHHVTGDTTYGTLENIKGAEDAGIRAYVPVTDFTKRTSLFGKDRFAFDPKEDVYRCPGGQLLRPQGKPSKEKLIRYRAPAKACAACSLRPECTNNKQGRSVHRHIEERYLEKARSYRGTELCERALRKRKAWIEPLFAEAKTWHAMGRFRLRRLEKVNVEALLVASVQNIKRLLAFGGKGPGVRAQEAALRPPAITVCRTYHAPEHRAGRSRRCSPLFSTHSAIIWHSW